MTQSGTAHFLLGDRENQLGQIVIDIAFQLNKTLGPGLLESVYEKCFRYGLKERGIHYLRQQQAPIFYKDLFLEDALRFDILVDDY
jgi:GxxExxY protein